MQATIPYCGPGPLPGEIWGRWNLDPYLLTGLALLLAWAAFRPGAAERRAALAACAVLFLAFVSPLCALASALFSARVTHHMLLIVAAAPLLVAGGLRLRRGLGLAVPLHILAVWLWHAPPPYAAALAHDGIYWLMQLTLLGSAVWFWSAALGREQDSLAAVGALLAGMVQMGLLGALITFAPAPLYAAHLGTTAPWGFSPLEDQQLAGLIMWVPASLAYLVPALRRAGRWLETGAAPRREG